MSGSERGIIRGIARPCSIGIALVGHLKGKLSESTSDSGRHLYLRGGYTEGSAHCVDGIVTKVAYLSNHRALPTDVEGNV